MEMNLERKREPDKKRLEKPTSDPSPELQIVEQTPEVPNMPAGISEISIKGFLRQQRKIDKQKKNKNEKTPGLNS